jgi:hypothetical protein
MPDRMNLFLPSGGDGSPTTLAQLQQRSPTLFVLQKDQHSARFNVNIALAKHRFVIRLTGGCGNMTEAYWAGMNNLVNALCGRTTDGIKHAPYDGLGLFGGTRMLYKRDVSVVRPGITEVFPAAMADCPDARFIGVLGQVSKKLQYLPWIMVSEESDQDFFTIVHQEQHSCAILTENPDEPSKSPWDREYMHCFDVCSELFRGGEWKGLLMAYNGGGVTAKEVDLWAKAGRDNPAWQVLLIDGSGGTVEKRTQDHEWLAQHPSVHVAQNATDSIWSELVKLGAMKA